MSGRSVERSGGMLSIVPASPDDWPEIRRIYLEGIRSGHATFETEGDVADAAAWFGTRIPDLIFKAVSPSGRMLGWCALSPVSSRRVYAGVAEVSVYVTEDARGMGVGTALLQYLVSASEAAGLWTLQASIFPENDASIRMHRRCGFRVVGMRHRIGRLRGVWRDTVLMERRTDSP
jgi:L-amino acid N-acyltransferase YncA